VWSVECDETFLAEVERDIEDAWVLVGTQALAPGPESWFVHESAGRSLIVARDCDGVLGAFVNSCTHRGTRLCRGTGQGRISCPYHGWVFGTDGSLLGAFRRAGLPDFDDADFGLARLSLETLGSLVFVHGERSAPDLRGSLGDVATQLEALGEPSQTDIATLESGWREALKSEGTVISPNSLLREKGATAVLTTFSPLSPGQTRRETRVFQVGKRRVHSP
jgi:phenylpropionate dioxygenase-like ring-hydroxylating dioxygenase large terminal subunit